MIVTATNKAVSLEHISYYGQTMEQHQLGYICAVVM